jgi:hypothetical protein
MVKSSELYKTLRQVLSPLMKELGFSKMQGTTLGWARPFQNNFSMIWFQCDKWGWNNVWGSSFTVNFCLAPAMKDAFTLKGRHARIGYLLEGFPELDVLRKMNNEIICRLPGTNYKKQNIKDIPLEVQIFLITSYNEDNEPAIYGRDIWLHYYSIEDAMSWANYFKTNLQQFASVFENDIKSEIGLGRVRFDKMICEVQQSSDIHKKVDILSNFIAIESDEVWKKSAITYLESAQNKVKEINSGNL